MKSCKENVSYSTILKILHGCFVLVHLVIVKYRFLSWFDLVPNIHNNERIFGIRDNRNTNDSFEVKIFTLTWLVQCYMLSIYNSYKLEKIQIWRNSLANDNKFDRNSQRTKWKYDCWSAKCHEVVTE